MKFTNKYNLPAYMYDWLVADDYDYINEPNTFSATSLLKPTRASIISSRHAEELEMDVSDLIASRYGNAIHDSIERINTPGVTKETRIKRTLDINGTTFTITGKYDLLVEENGTFTLRDIKSTSVWSFIYGGKDEDYRAQLSIYRWLLSVEKEVKPTAFIDFYFTDWQSMKAKTEAGYPPRRLYPGYKIDLLSLEDTEKMIRDKLIEITDYSNIPDDDLPKCTKKELWAEEDKFAVYKIGNKRATKVCDSKKDAENYIALNNMKSTLIQHRPGKVKRCAWCSAAPFCSQRVELEEEGLLDL